MSEASNVANIRRERDVLAEEVQRLKGMLKPVHGNEWISMGLSRSQGAIFERLKRPGVTATESLQTAVEVELNREITRQTLAVQLTRLRKKLTGKYRIINVWGTGYRMEKVQ